MGGMESWIMKGWFITKWHSTTTIYHVPVKLGGKNNLPITATSVSRTLWPSGERFQRISWPFSCFALFLDTRQTDTTVWLFRLNVFTTVTVISLTALRPKSWTPIDLSEPGAVLSLSCKACWSAGITASWLQLIYFYVVLKMMSGAVLFCVMTLIN